MKHRITFLNLMLFFLLLTGCSSKSSLYESGMEELNNGNYKKAIEVFSEYEKNYNDSNPLKDSYCQYADFLYTDGDYIGSLYYYKLANELAQTDNTISDSILNLNTAIYNKGLDFLNNDQELLAFQYLSYIEDNSDFDKNLIPEDPLLGIWNFEQNYIKLTKSSLSYLYNANTNTTPTSQDFTEETILILGDWFINEEGSIEIDDHYLTHHNDRYVKYIEIIDNDTIYINGSNTLTGEYKRIK